MKKLIVLLTILMLVTVQSYAGGKNPCNKNKSELNGFKKSNRTHTGECGVFGKLKMKKQDKNRYHNYN